MNDEEFLKREEEIEQRTTAAGLNHRCRPMRRMRPDGTPRESLSEEAVCVWCEIDRLRAKVALLVRERDQLRGLTG